jgi:F-type H+-transporting ATPase subunit b
MNDTLLALGDLLVKAIPTILFFILLTAYLKRVFFRPMAAILDQRKKATEGVRELAQRAFEAAEQKSSEFERALQMARAQIHEEHEALRRAWEQEQVEAIAKARAEADARIEQAKQDIARDLETVEAELNSSIEPLSERIVNSLLSRRAA